ncbi:hypothetical protein LAJ55_14870, partial [Streptococcus pneumoniae]|nr:hypothetical protein [Streptococcus pneumoniae]
PPNSGTVNQILITNGSGTTSWVSAGTSGIGTVTSVAISAPAYLGVTGSPITTSGTITFTPTTTGTGSLVLSNSPTFTGPVTVT